MEEKEELIIRMSQILDNMDKTVNNLDKKLGEIDKTDIVPLKTQVAVLVDKVERLERIIYGALAVIVGQFVALIFLWMKSGH